MGDKTSLVKIGQLARLAGILPSKVRYYVKEGLLNPVDRTRGGYFLFEKSESLSRLRLIDKLKNKERLSLAEIKDRLSLPTENRWSQA
jgi:DNA-binding transcriptional MerR regulator